MTRDCKQIDNVDIPTWLRGEKIQGNWYDIDYSQTDGSGTMHIRGVYNPGTRVLANIVAETDDDYNRMPIRELVDCIA